MKKARQWLTDHDIDYVFHDYKKQGVPEKELKQWVAQLGWETLLNQRGTTWRKLDTSVKINIDQTSAIKIMMESPSIIKRPVMNLDGNLFIGFSEEDYKKHLYKSADAVEIQNNA